MKTIGEWRKEVGGDLTKEIIIDGQGNKFKVTEDLGPLGVNGLCTESQGSTYKVGWPYRLYNSDCVELDTKVVEKG